ncbi:hypothetical protein WA026_013972 [Henosepilachna vigintioctopunctata]|uniref:Parathyroid hormone/parathyroid hormone-related peptide receptor n=1 Tax=Henosepilachna vigintioctopunctata TaxID=420089 RepID=A0AAW1U229_9CUCU
MESNEQWNHTDLLKEWGRKCLKNAQLKNRTEKFKFCPTVYDGILCWKKTKAGDIAVQSCFSNELLRPSLAGFASLPCGTNGKWYTPNGTANYTQCGKFYVYNNDKHIYSQWLPILQKCTHIGYTISIVSLIFALIIFIYLKRLHCARNYLHMHLFISSIMRSLMSLVKDVLFVNGTSLFTETSYMNGELTIWFCKVFISLRQYFILTNYMMLLMEGIYLHNLIFLKLFSDKTSVKIYVLTGWVLPISFVVPWVVLRTTNKSGFCWTMMDKTSLLLEIPIGIIVIINFILFILIVRILCLKLNSIFVQQRKVKYRKLVKATLILLPLFGVPYTISVIMYFYVSKDKTLEIVWLFFDQGFTAFQGFLAALAYCLFNSDVQSEIKRRYHCLLDKKELKRSRTISHTLQSFVPNGDDLTEIQQCTIENGKQETKL